VSHKYSENPTNINLSDDRKSALIRAFKTFFQEEFDEQLSQFKAEQVVDFFIKTLGPAVYNQAICDARAFMMEKLEDLDADFFMDNLTDI